MVFLEDLLSADDFGAAVDGLAREFRDRHELPAIHQLGLVVPDVKEAAHTLEDHGIGPFFIAHGSAAWWRERGQDGSVRGDLGLAYYKGFELELLEPGEGSDFYRQSLDPEGRIVVQHLGLLVRDVDEWIEKLEAAGTSTWVRGRVKMGPVRAEFAYMDAMDEVGFIIELIAWCTFGWITTPPTGVVKVLGRLQKWSGKRSMSV